MQNQQLKIEDTGLAPSFSCYSNDSITSKAIAKAIHEEEVARLIHENGDVDDDDFEFALVLSDEHGSVKETTDLHSSPSGTKGKKSSSTGGSGSKRWLFWYLLRQSNSEGKKPKKADSLKQKRNSVTAYEEFYVQKRTENEVGKKRSYLPYRKDIVVGLFANVNWIKC